MSLKCVQCVTLLMPLMMSPLLQGWDNDGPQEPQQIQAKSGTQALWNHNGRP